MQIYDDSGMINAVWYNNKYIKNNFVVGGKYVFFGKVPRNKQGRLQMTAPVYEKEGNERFTGKIIPIYPLTAKLSQKIVQSAMEAAIKEKGQLEEYIPEHIREEYMIAEDLYENILRQKLNVMDAAKHSNRILFVDTDAITTMFYSELLFDEYSEEDVLCSLLAESVNHITKWDLVLFLEPDVEFIQDGTRSEEIASDRTKYSDNIKRLFDLHLVSYHCITGNYLERFNKAKKLIKEKIGLDTKW
jgi:nicotinamide riboside kinase